MNQFDYLGKGEKFPLDVDNASGIVLISDKELIKQSILDNLRTPKGTRYFLEAYGCDLSMLTFQPNDAILESLGIFYISESLYLWEKRIRVVKIISSNTTGNISGMNFEIKYRILSSNEIDSLVFPFYKEIIN